MKVEDCKPEVNRKKISIWYNECYKTNHTFLPDR